MSEPLAERFRPKHLDEVVGQEHLTGEGGILRRIIEAKRPLSIILWGPPGCGKTTLAHLYAKAFSANLICFSAVLSGIAEIRKAVEKAGENTLFHRHTLLFVDEIHRFNKAQQDAFLPHVERGTLILVGATTENPSFSLNDALLSRLRVLTLRPLGQTPLKALLERYEAKAGELPLTAPAKALLLRYCQGDGRYLYNLIENLKVRPVSCVIDADELPALLQKRAALFDRGDGHYNLISALHKAIRTSDPDASLYWLARMFEAGEDPLFIARRLIRMASEDIGLADPQALVITVAARDAYQMLGSPEGELALAEAAIYLALAPKSNAAYLALKRAREMASSTTHIPPPKELLNAPTRLLKELGHGTHYRYDHDFEGGCSGQTAFPKGLAPASFYEPVERGFEREMQKRLAFYRKKRKVAREVSGE